MTASKKIRQPNTLKTHGRPLYFDSLKEMKRVHEWLGRYIAWKEQEGHTK